ncbi:MAG TPA: hypothetical protein VFZ00_14140 [Solirubrobacter sp.]|nr:hypothetical protein [Solirubrobacter sp.]
MRSPAPACRSSRSASSSAESVSAASRPPSAAVAHLAPEGLRGSAFGLLATVQSPGNLAASAIAGLLWTLTSPTAAFIYAAAWMMIAITAFAARRATRT